PGQVVIQHKGSKGQSLKPAKILRPFAPRWWGFSAALKTESQRPLHHARWARIGRLTESGVGLNDLIVDDTEGQTGINVVEIRVVEKVVRLPAELEAKLLAHAKVLEHRQVKVDESGTAKQISRRVADLSLLRRTGEARSVNEDGSSVGGVRHPMIRITSHVRARIHFSAGEVGDQ